MRRLFKKGSRFFLLILTGLMMIVSCNVGNKPSSDSSDEQMLSDFLPYALSDFQIVRPDSGASNEVKEAAVQLNNTIQAYLGKLLPIKTDYLADDERACEILIGATTRCQSQEVLATLEDGDLVIRSVITENGVKLVLMGTNDGLTVSAVHKFEELIKSNTVESEGQIKRFELKENLYDTYSDYTLNIGDPILVAKGDSYEELGWGPYQFPILRYTTKGSIICSWHTSNDRIYNGKFFDIPSAAVSDDGGLTWREKTDKDEYAYTNYTKMSNGKYFAGFSGDGTYPVTYLDQYDPVISDTNGNTELYLASDVKEYQPKVYAREYDPSTGKTTTFLCTVNWPYMPLDVSTINGQKIVYPLSKTMNICNSSGGIAIGKDLYFCVYSRGFALDGTVTRLSGYVSVYVFKSSDNARTWNCISCVSIDNNVRTESLNHSGELKGFVEPDMTVMRDGSVVMLMRTGEDQPCYMVRSTDNCQTWSKPQKFDEVGVFPQIISLGCGVTLASYGRPGMFLRSTSDPSGLTWKDSIEIEMSGKLKEGTNRWNSCYYTYFLPLDDHTVLWVYSDFYYSDTGKTADASKCVMARIITVEPASNK